MEFSEFLKQRKFIKGGIKKELKARGYKSEFLDTKVPQGEESWPKGTGASCQREICKAYKGKIPFHFAYIKFYEQEGQCFALVAGKTNLYSPDFQFTTKTDSKEGDRKDRAKRFLQQYHYRWFCQQVLAVWKPDQEFQEETEDIANRNHGPQSKRAKAIERKIQELLGLFSS